MATLTIAWEYLTGYAVATDPTMRDRTEWPPHPARVFMALAAAWAETEPPERATQDAASGRPTSGLAPLETLGDPEMRLPTVGDDSERSNVTYYVPVNDKAGPSAATLQSCPALTRSKQADPSPVAGWGTGRASCTGQSPRTRNSTARPWDASAARSLARPFVLAHRDGPGRGRRTDRRGPESTSSPTPCNLTVHVRSLSRGTLEMLQERFGEEPRRRHAELDADTQDSQRQEKDHHLQRRQGTQGRDRRQIQTLENELLGIVPRPPVRPTTGLWTGYREVDRRETFPEEARPVAVRSRDSCPRARQAGHNCRSFPRSRSLKALRNTILTRVRTARTSLGERTPPGRSTPPRRQRTLAVIPLPVCRRRARATAICWGRARLSPYPPERTRAGSRQDAGRGERTAKKSDNRPRQIAWREMGGPEA